MRYLVTGGGGFIGSNFVRELLDRDEQVRVVDNFSTGRRENLKEFGGQFELVEGDIRHFWTMSDACQDIDYVIHLAALPSVFRSVEDPLTSTDININGTATVLEAARRQGVKKVMSAVVPKFIACLQEDRKPTVYGDGEQTRDFTYIDNVIEAVLGACAQDKVTCGEYNLACGGQYTVNALIEQLARILGKPADAVYVDARPGDIVHSYADVSKLERDFGFKAGIGFDEGLAKTIAYYERENRLSDRVAR
jgi:nucleoside-diphosphate-sugar epimerase